jgi:predicted dinucleotide-binding enzyme
MNISVIGHGNVGSTLAIGWANAGHKIYIGARNPEENELEKLSRQENIEIYNIPNAVTKGEVILIAIPAQAMNDLARNIKNDVADKIIIDASNSVRMSPDGFETGAAALKQLTKCEHVVKGFNTTGYENMRNPQYGAVGIDMFTAGDSQKGKEIVKKLAYDLGFENCYDFGGDDKFKLIEDFAKSWINLAIMQGEGRNIAFKVLRRE